MIFLQTQAAIVRLASQKTNVQCIGISKQTYCKYTNCKW